MHQGCAVNISQHGSGACVLILGVLCGRHTFLSKVVRSREQRLAWETVGCKAQPVNREQTDSRASAEQYLVCLGDHCLDQLTVVVENPALGTTDMTP